MLGDPSVASGTDIAVLSRAGRTGRPVAPAGLLKDPSARVVRDSQRSPRDGRMVSRSATGMGPRPGPFLRAGHVTTMPLRPGA